MDNLLSRVTQQAMNYAIRSGVTITAGYAFRQSARLLKAVEDNDKGELQELQERLESKIMIISPAIDMIELISARGNTSLESAVSLTKALRWDIQALGQKLARAANEETLSRKGSSRAKSKAHNQLMLRHIITDIKKLLIRIEDAVPLINLAITTSGVNLSASLPTTVSPSRLLQASTFLTAGDTQYSQSQVKYVQIGPTFVLSLYMLFAGNVRPQNEEDVRTSTWKEVVHKAKLKLVRGPLDSFHELPDLDPTTTPNYSAESPVAEKDDLVQSHMSGGARSEEYAYQIIIVEDLDDDRVHTYDDDELQPGPYDDVELAGIREAVPIHEISKIFYADTGKILNIGSDGETNTPVLLLKRNSNAIPPRKMVERDGAALENELDERSELPTPSKDGVGDVYQSEIDAQIHRESRASSLMPPSPAKSPQTGKEWQIPRNLDPEWLAFEVFTSDPDSDTEEEESELSAFTTSPLELRKPTSSCSTSLEPSLTSALSDLHIEPQPSRSTISSTPPPQVFPPKLRMQAPSIPTVRTSLSLLETLLRLLSLQQFQQASHLSIPDELLNFFLSEAATTGAAAGDEAGRRRLRNEARRRVGFDPYDESPIKRRGEAYQSRGSASQAGDHWGNGRDGQDYADEGGWYADDFDGNGNYTDNEWEHQSYDEGYHTRRLSSRQSVSQRLDSPQIMLRSRESTPESPRLGKRRPNGQREGTGRRFGNWSPKTPQKPVGKVKQQDAGLGKNVRQGSPLARSGTSAIGGGTEVTPTEKKHPDK